ncbi:MAG: tRNA (adenosine(37)-N6)-threonylcarbamoyltransferase complex dimerization subunit type 1 TsaB [Deltaproteobacteria bacterium]|nr:tRNA (adenosine(37)-N6)-threonylcarbamoyltransferase complex dimerization subunit type 1 TsaB [Deltaproteobacteria bacterium]
MSSLHKQAGKIEPGELTLVINATEGRLQLALGRPAAQAGAQNETGEPELLAAQDWQAVAQGAELLAPALEQMLRNLKLKPGHIGKIAAVTGPGGFTGLRLATVTASALARALGAASAGLEYLPLLAAGARDFLENTDYFWAVTHARRGLIYAQGFSRSRERRSELLPLHPLAVLRLEELPELLAAITLFNSAPCSASVIFGSGLSKNFAALAPELGRVCAGFRLMPHCLDHPAPRLLLQAALAARYDREDLAPLYARASDAEDNLPQIADSLGLGRHYAKARLAELLNEPARSSR